MTNVRIKGFKVFRDRHGKMRCYHRKTGKPIDLVIYPLGTNGFLGECGRMQQLTTLLAEAKPGTLGLIIQKYRAHTAFSDLAARTRSDYQRCFDFLMPLNDTPVSRITPNFVVKLRDKAAELHGRRLGTYVKAVLSVVLGWGVEQGYLPSNAAFRIKNIKKPKGSPEANRPWTDIEREVVANALPSHMRLPVSLMMYCGLDPQDALRLPRTAIRDGRFDTRRGKTGEPVWLVLPESVKSILQEVPQHNAITLCANSYGRPWTVSGFRASWRPIKTRLELEGLIAIGLTMKGLRHTTATILAEMGFDERTIADYLGQKTTEMARHYSRRADRTKKLTKVVKEFDLEVNRRRTKIVKPAT